jgi:WS/DGAT/MGAT family acyltransferase
MSRDRLSTLDASFLQVESPTAHMHVGWGAVFAPAPGGRPDFDALQAHVGSRLGRAPRYRQKLAEVPLSLSNPVWVDDDAFDLGRHVRRATSTDFGEVVDATMSAPLDHDRPLWELRIADRLGDGRVGVVGKAHHCMVDGLAAVELAALLLDPTPEPPPPPADGWLPAPRPGRAGLLAAGLRERAAAGLDLALAPARLALSPRSLLGLPGKLLRDARALAHAGRPAALPTPINEPISPRRHLARIARPLDDLRRIKHGFGATVNDVVLAVSAGGLRRFLAARGERPCRLKTMVPVSVRGREAAGELGNRISFVFVDLPCDEPDPVRQLAAVHAEMSDRKGAGEPEGADEVVQALEYAPPLVKAPASRLIASPRTFNLTVSNIPGPREPLYMLGCELEEAYPVVPIADRHGLSIGMTTIREDAFFGVYAAPDSLPDADALAEDIDRSIDELLDRVA